MYNNRNIDEQLNQYSYHQLINTYSISFQKNYQYPHLLYYYFFLTAFIDFLATRGNADIIIDLELSVNDVQYSLPLCSVLLFVECRGLRRAFELLRFACRVHQGLKAANRANDSREGEPRTVKCQVVGFKTKIIRLRKSHRSADGHNLLWVFH